MKWLTFKIQKEPGFRFNLIDVLLIVFILLVTVLVYEFYPENFFYLLPPYIGLTFFLFCNVFRIGNNIEPVWYVTFFIIFCYGYFFQPEIYWVLILSVCEPLKVALIIYRIRRADYAGIFHERLGKGKQP